MAERNLGEWLNEELGRPGQADPAPVEAPELRQPSDLEPPPENTLEGFLEQHFADEDNAERLRATSNLRAAQAGDPDVSGEALRAHEATGVAPIAVKSQPESYRMLADMRRMASEVDQSAAIRRWAQDPYNAEIGVDDTTNLNLIDQIVNGAKAVKLGYGRGDATMELGIANWNRMFNPDGEFSSDLDRARAVELRQRMAVENPPGILGTIAGNFGELGASTVHTLTDPTTARLAMGGAMTAGAVAAIAGQLGPQAALPEELVTVPGAALAGGVAGVQAGVGTVTMRVEAGHAYEEFRALEDLHGNRSMEHETALGAALFAGMMNGAIETAGMGVILRTTGLDRFFKRYSRDVVARQLQRPTMRQAFKQFGKAYASTWGAEVGIEMLQEVVVLGVGEVAKQASAGDFATLTAEETADRLAEIFMKVGTGMLPMAGIGASPSLVADLANVRRADEAAATFEALAEASSESKVRQRVPERFRQFVEEATSAGPVDTIYVEAERVAEYFQSQGVSMEQVENELPVLKEQREALAAGGDYAIPTADYATYIAPTEHHAGLAPHLRLQPDAFSQAEAQEVQKGFQAELEAATTEATEQAEALAGELGPLDAIVQTVVEQQVQAGTPRDVAETNADLYRAFFGTQLERGNIPDALRAFQALQFSVRRDLSGAQFADTGRVLGQDELAELASLEAELEAMPEPVTGADEEALSNLRLRIDEIRRAPPPTPTGPVAFELAESEAARRRRVSRGEELVYVDAETLAQQLPADFVPNEQRLEAARGFQALEEAPDIAARGGAVIVGQGRHRITAAAERGGQIPVAIAPDEVAELSAILGEPAVAEGAAPYVAEDLTPQQLELRFAAPPRARAEAEAPAARPEAAAPEDGPRPRGFSVLGNRVSAEFDAGRAAPLLGQPIGSSADLAEAAQIYRDPRYETLRIFFMRGDTVVHQTGVSSRAPGMSDAFLRGDTMDTYIDRMRASMRDSGADGYYLLHNHPSGEPSPSGADVRFTRMMAEQLAGFRAHVVINQDSYAVLEALGEDITSEVHAVPSFETRSYRIDRPSVPHPILGQTITGPNSLAKFAKEVQITPGYGVAIGTQRGRISGIAEFRPADFAMLGDPDALERMSQAELERERNRTIAAVHQFERATGAQDVFLVGMPRAAENYLRLAVSTGLVRDALFDNGASLFAEMGIGTLLPDFERGIQRRGGIEVREEGAEYNELGRVERVATRVPRARPDRNVGDASDNTTVVDISLAPDSWTRKVANLLRAPYEVVTRRRKVKGQDRYITVQKWEGYAERGLEGLDDQAAIERFTEFVKDNVLWLFDQVPESTRQRSRLWYVGANRYARDLAAAYGLDEHATAGVIASLSPQKDWFENAATAERVIRAYVTQQDFAWTPEMTETMNRIFGGERFATEREALEGRTLAELGAEDAVLQGMWIRVYSQTYDPEGYPSLTPEGALGPEPLTAAGEPLRIRWNNTNEVAKAVEILNNPTVETISERLGVQHKVRSFYDNIISPGSLEAGVSGGQDVTIDTHAVAAGHLRPFGSLSREVLNNFSTPNDAATGLTGTYAMYQEAYNRAAEERGVLPREMQSITWEAVRGLFTPTFKTSPAALEVDAAWNDYREGRISLGEARERVLELAGGIEPPFWVGAPSEGPAARAYEAPRAPDDEAALPGAGVSGRPAAEPRGDRGAAGTERPDAGARELFQRGGPPLAPHERVVVDVRRRLDRGGEGPVSGSHRGGDPGDVSAVRRYVTEPWVAERLNAAGVDTPDLLELDPSNAQEFADAIGAAADGSPYGAAVFIYPVDEYADMRLFVTEDRSAGFALKGDDIVSVFNGGRAHRRVAYPMLLLAQQEGGARLDAFDTQLPRIYSTAGFSVASRMSWNDEFAPEGWDKGTFSAWSGGEPDVVFMAATPARETAYVPGEGALVEDYDQAVALQGDAVQAQLEFAQERGGRRGSITLPETLGEGPVTIRLFESANLSTFLHESGHLFLEVMRSVAEAPGASEQVQADWATLTDWLGVPRGARIGTEQHEQFARGFEAYLREGRAPSADLRSAFSRFRAWLLNLYRNLRGLDVELSDEVRGVLDRMLATDEEIRAARAQQNMEPLFREAEQAGMTQTEHRAYLRAVARSAQAARERLERKHLAEVQRERTKQWRAEERKTRAQVEDEYAEKPLYLAWHYLRTGELLRGELPAEHKPLKLSREAILDHYGEERGKTILAALPGRGRNLVWQKTGGVHQDLVAEFFGVESGEALIEGMINAQPYAAAVKAETDRRMAERFPGMLDDGSIRLEAMEAVHVDEELAVLERELTVLARQAGRPEPRPRELARRLAEDVIAEKTVREVTRVGHFLKAERRAAAATERALLAGDYAEATRQKRQQLIQAHLYRAAQQATQEVESGRRRANRLTKNAARKAIDPGYYEQIASLLEQYDFKPASAPEVARRQSLRAFIDERLMDGDEIAVPDYLVDRARREHYSTLTMGEFRGLVDSLTNLEHLGRLKTKLQLAGETREREAVVTELVNAARENMRWREDVIDFPESRGNVRRLRDWIGAFDAAHVKTEFLMERLDGNVEGGVWHSNIFQPIANAEVAEQQLMEEYTPRLKALFDLYTPAERARWYRGIHVPGATPRIQWNRATILALALNWGNVANRKAVLDGYGAAGLDEAGVNRALATLTQRDWDFVEGVWELVDSLWPRVTALQRSLTGVVPEKVEADPFQIPGGTRVVRGGYYPLAYDPDRSYLAFRREQKRDGEEMHGSNWVRPTTRQGHTKERVGSGGQPVRLELSVLTTHLTNVIHDLTHREAIIYVDKLLQDPRVRAAVEHTAGRQLYRGLRPWLAEVATDRRDPATPVEQALRKARHGATIVSMGWKLTTAIVQPLGYLQSVELLGEKYALRGLSWLYGNPRRTTEKWGFVRARSTMMRNRQRTFDRDVRSQLDRLGPGSRSHAIHQTYFAMIGMLDMATSVPTWYGGYIKELERQQAAGEAVNEDKAIAMGDRVVRMAQSSGAAKDLARIQAGGEASRIFTMFYSYFSVLNNLIRRRGQMTKMDAIGLMRMGTSFLYLVMLPALLAEIITGRAPDEDDDETWLEWAARTTVAYPLASYVGVRDIVSAMTTDYGYGITPVADAFEMTARFGKAAASDVTEGELSRTTVKAGLLTAGYWVPFPARQTWLSGEYFWDWMNGDIDEFSVYEAMVTGNQER